MTRTKKTGRYQERKMARLITEVFPHVDPAQLTPVIARFMASFDFVHASLCQVSVENLDHYSHEARHPVKGGLKTGWCETHQVLHRYKRQHLVDLVHAERDAAVDAVRALGGGAPLPLDLWDMLTNRFNSALAHVLGQHHDDMMAAREAYYMLQQRQLANFYDALPLEQQLDYFFCGRKKYNATREEAEATLQEQIVQFKQKGLLVYECRYCDGWHLAHEGKLNDYTGATIDRMTSLAEFTWYHSLGGAKRYAKRFGCEFDKVSVRHEDVVSIREGRLQPVFVGG
jgi:hypothetical protein